MLTRQGTTFILLTCLRLVLGASCPSDWSAVSADQLSSLDPVCFAQATSADLAALPGPSCAGFDAARVSQLETTVDGSEACGGLSPSCAPRVSGCRTGQGGAVLGKSELSYACAGLTASCASSLSPAGAGGLQSECLGYLSIGAVSALGPRQVAAIPASSWSGWTRENIAGLGESCAGVMYDQFAAIGMSMLTDDACAGLTPECAQHLPSSSLATVSSKCVERLSKDFVAALSERHVVAMPAPAFAGITRDNVGGLRESVSAFSGFIDACTREWSVEQALAPTLDKLARSTAPNEHSVAPHCRSRTEELSSSADRTFVGSSILAEEPVRPEHLLPQAEGAPPTWGDQEIWRAIASADAVPEAASKRRRSEGAAVAAGGEGQAEVPDGIQAAEYALRILKSSPAALRMEVLFFVTDLHHIQLFSVSCSFDAMRPLRAARTVGKRNSDASAYAGGVVGAGLLLLAAAGVYLYLRCHRGRRCPAQHPRSSSRPRSFIELNSSRLFRDKPYQRSLSSNHIANLEPLKQANPNNIPYPAEYLTAEIPESRDIFPPQILLSDRELRAAAALSSACPQPESDRLAKSLAYVYMSGGRCLDLVLAQCLAELRASRSRASQTLFRGDSPATRLFSHYARVECAQWLAEALRPAAAELQASAVDVAVDPFLVTSAFLEYAVLEQVLAGAQRVFERIRETGPAVPAPLRVLLRGVREGVAEAWPGAETAAVGGFFFLRVVNPALSSPAAYGLFDERRPYDRAQRMLVYISKLLQHLANNTLPGSKDPRLVRLDAFVHLNRAHLVELYDEMLSDSAVAAAPQGVTELPKDVVDSSMAFIQQFLNLYWNDVERALETSEGKDGPMCRCLRPWAPK
eukprot:m51a1_g13405 putative gtpase-activator protein for ras family gtpase (862) ;mRNA; r:28738-37748